MKLSERKKLVCKNIISSPSNVQTTAKKCSCDRTANFDAFLAITWARYDIFTNSFFSSISLINMQLLIPIKLYNLTNKILLSLMAKKSEVCGIQWKKLQNPNFDQRRFQNMFAHHSFARIIQTKKNVLWDTLITNGNELYIH